MTTKHEVGNREPAEQVVKALESLRVIKLALASKNQLDEEDLACLEFTLLETMEDLRPVRELLEAHPIGWDGSRSTPSYPQTADIVFSLHKAA